MKVKSYLIIIALFLCSIINAERIPMYFCTAADTHYFKILVNLIGSIHKTNFDDLEEIAVFDIGLTRMEKLKLARMAKVNVYDIEKVHPDILKPIETHPNKRVPGSYAWKPVIMKQCAEKFPYFLYVDAGTTVLHSLRDVFKHIIQKGYFVLDVGPWSIRWQSTKRVVDYFDLATNDRQWILESNTHAIDAGLQGISKLYYESYLLPMYDLVQHRFELFIDDGTTPNGFGTCRHDQTLFSIFTRLLKFDILLHDTDGTNQQTLLSSDGNIVPIHITWNPTWVTDKTVIFRSRGHIPQYEMYKRCIRNRK